MVPSGSEVVVIDGAAMMVSDRFLVPVPPTLSVTRTVKLDVPAVVGVPVIAPVDGLSVSPAGRVPDCIDQV